MNAPKPLTSGLLATIVFVVVLSGTAAATTIFGVDAANNLVRFDSAAPGTIVVSKTIQGLASGETISGLDFRPLDGTLWALGSTSRLYIIDYITSASTATATPVGSAGAFTISGAAFGFDFNPTVDRIRVVSDTTNQNLRLNPNDGTLAATDTPLAYAAGDPNVGGDPNEVGSAYTNNFSGATSTTLFGIDSSLDILVRQGGVNGSPSPNNGQLTTIGALGVNVGTNVGFDIDGGGTAFMAATVGGIAKLYTINLATGAATPVGATGQIGTGTALRGIAVAPTAFICSLVGTTASFTGSVAANAIVFDQSGGLLRHNRFSGGDAGFNSDFDFDPTVAGDQTLSASNPAVTIVVNAGGNDDTITIGSASAPASSMAAAFAINGQSGGDTLTINDAADLTGRTVTINGATSTITGLGGPITYGTVENLTINGGSGNDTFNVQGISGVSTNINAGGGSDTVAFANAASLNGGFVDGGAGSNTLDYSGYTTGVTVDLSSASAQTLFFATLTGQQEPGPLSSSPASGRLVGSLNAAQTALTFTITYQGLTGAPISGTHFHNQIAGVAGPIVRGLFSSEQNGLVTPSGSFAGVWSNSDPTIDPPASDAPIRPLNAPSPVTPNSTNLQELLANRIYFDIHTLPNFPSGEIRGQLISQGTVNPATGTGGVRGFDNVTGGSGGDVLTGNANVNVLRGGAGNDTLVGGQGGDQLFGEGDNDTLVWNNGDGSDFMEGGAGNDIIQINGSPTGGDQFLVQVNPADANRLRFDRTNLGLFNLNIGTAEELDFNTLGGDDTATIDFAGGNPIPVGGIKYDGGTGNDRLVLQRSAGSYVAGAMVHTATGNGAGSMSVTGQGGTLTYTGLEPIDDTVPTTTYTFNAPAASSRINLINGPTISGFATTQVNDGGASQFELLNFAGKTNVIINSGAGDQSVLIDNATGAAGLTNLTVNASSGADDIHVAALATGIATSIDSRGGNDDVRIVGAGIPTGATLQLDGAAGTDRLIYETGGVAVTTSPGPGTGQTTIMRSGSANVVYQSFEDVTFPTGTSTVAQPLNISTRMRVQTGENVLIGGFIIAGTQPKKVIIRAIGPSLESAGIPGFLPDPTLELHNATSTLATNDNWKIRSDGTSQQAEIEATTIPPQAELESAVVRTLPANNTGYTVIVSDKNGAPGIGSVEVYDLDQPADSRLANISTRGFVETGDNVMIGGFILGNKTGNTRIALRGLGPSLAQLGIANALSDPTLDLRDGNGTRLIFNDNWMDDPNQSVQLSSSGLAPSQPNEAGIFTTLPPGQFTVILAGANGATGVGLVEVYNIQ